MSDNKRGTNPFDPTDERTADEPTQGDVVNTPRPEETRRKGTNEDAEPALPNDDPTLRIEM